jgi:DNA processing protein
MDNDELFYYLALQSVDGIGPVNAKKLVDHFGGVKPLFDEKQHKIKKIKGLNSGLFNRLKKREIFDKAEREIRFLENQKLRAVCFSDQDYPSKLKHCHDAPLLLFQKGNFNINNRKIISIVGTRLMTSYGSQFLKEFIQEIKIYDPVIVSGLAYGIDICAHQESMRNNICTVGILAHGLDRIYPKSHEGIAQKMIENGGLYTEFRSGTIPDRENFVKRNRIIAGISEATLVVESYKKGGSLITAQLASSYYRDVLAVPGRTTDRFSQGCNMLIKSNRAAMITSLKDLEYALGWTREPSAKRLIQKKLFVELDEQEKRLYNLLKDSEKKLLDQLALESGFSIQKTLTILLQLELKGMVSGHSGKRFQAL